MVPLIHCYKVLYRSILLNFLCTHNLILFFALRLFLINCPVAFVINAVTEEGCVCLNGGE